MNAFVDYKNDLVSWFLDIFDKKNETNSLINCNSFEE